jgi:hypothetical protein
VCQDLADLDKESPMGGIIGAARPLGEVSDVPEIQHERRMAFSDGREHIVVSIHVSVGPVIVSINPGRFRHALAARTADRAFHHGLTRFLAGIRSIHLPNWVQGVAGSNPAVPIEIPVATQVVTGSFHSTAGSPRTRWTAPACGHSQGSPGDFRGRHSCARRHIRPSRLMERFTPQEVTASGGVFLFLSGGVSVDSVCRFSGPPRPSSGPRGLLSLPLHPAAGNRRGPSQGVPPSAHPSFQAGQSLPPTPPSPHQIPPDRPSGVSRGGEDRRVPDAGVSAPRGFQRLPGVLRHRGRVAVVTHPGFGCTKAGRAREEGVECPVRSVFFLAASSTTSHCFVGG